MFIRNKIEEATLGYPIYQICGYTPRDGEIGIEIEVEGRNLPRGGDVFDDEEEEGGGLGPYWTHHVDHSLRGEENAEYVLNKPISFSSVPAALDDLWGRFSNLGSELDISNRTSVHVHLNVQKWTANQLAAFTAAYFAVEELLTEYCGEHRVGNLFCLRGIDAPAIVSSVRDFLKSGMSASISDNFHYAGLNIQAIQKFGSVEVRTMRGCTTSEEIQTWVDILERLYRYAEGINDPRDICHMFSYGGPVPFLRSLLPNHADMLIEVAGWDAAQLSASLQRGVRMAQDICYRSINWDKFTVVTPDPFGRYPSMKKKKVAISQTMSVDEMFDTFFADHVPPPLYPAPTTPLPLEELNSGLL